jgi:hypothetical protein
VHKQNCKGFCRTPLLICQQSVLLAGNKSRITSQRVIWAVKSNPCSLVWHLNTKMLSLLKITGFHVGFCTHCSASDVRLQWTICKWLKCILCRPGAHPKGRAAGLQPPPQIPQNRNLKKHSFCRYYDIKFYVIYPSAEISH